MIDIVAALVIIASLVVSLSVLLRLSLAENYPVAFVLAVILLITVVGVSSELLHWLNNYNVRNIRVFWIAVTVLTVSLTLVQRAQIIPPMLKFTAHERAAYGLLGSIFTLTLLTFLTIAPNNWDSITYHLSRAAHWLQNGNLDFFPTANARQNVVTPLPDLTLSHLIAANPSAHLVGFSQWLSGVAICCAVGLLASLIWQPDRALKMTQSRSTFIATSVVLAGTIPMLLSQMSTTQVDLVAGLPLAGAVVCFLWVRQTRWNAASLLMGLCLALAFAIKATALAILMPVFLLFVWTVIKQKRLRDLLLAGSSFLLFFVVLSLRHLWTSASVQDYATKEIQHVFNAEIGFESLIVNTIRNIASVMQTSNLTWNSHLSDLVAKLVSQLQMNLNPENSTISGAQFYLSDVLHEDYLGAPLHLGLLIIASATYMLLRAWRQNVKIGLLILLFVLQFMLIAILFRWQPWINRFTFLPIAFASPVTAWLILKLHPRVQSFVTYSLLLLAIIWVLVQPMRGLLGTSWLPEPVVRLNSVPKHESPLRLNRFEQLFASGSADTYKDALKYAQSLDITELVLVTGSDSWEYPIWFYSAVNEVKWVIRHHPETSPQIPSQPNLHVGNPHRISGLLCINSCALSGRDIRGTLDASTVRVFGQGPFLIVGRVTPP